MEAGPKMFYPAQVVDGVVHSFGGPELAAELSRVQETAPGVRCPIGQVVRTGSPGRLSTRFSSLFHTVPPMWPGDVEKQGGSAKFWSPMLSSCYRSALDLLWTSTSVSTREVVIDNPDLTWWRRVTACFGMPRPSAGPRELAFQGAERLKQLPVHTLVSPVLGAGARGAPFDLACFVAARTLRIWTTQRMQERSDAASTQEADQQRAVMFSVRGDAEADALLAELTAEFKGISE